MSDVRAAFARGTGARRSRGSDSQMMNVNLIPAPRRAAKRRRVHLRRCAVGCVAWAALSVAAACLAHAVWRVEDPLAAERLARMNEEINHTERAVSDVRLQLAKAQSTFRGNEAIAAQPDWSILLALLGKQVENDVVLKNAHVRPANTVRGAIAVAPRPDARRAAPRTTGAGDPAAPPAADAIPYVLEATGLALDYPAANQFVLRLEATGLFSRVTLLDTAKESFMEKNKTAFRLECVLDQSPGRQDRPANGSGNAKSGRPRGNVARPTGGAAASGRD